MVLAALSVSIGPMGKMSPGCAVSFAMSAAESCGLNVEKSTSLFLRTKSSGSLPLAPDDGCFMERTPAAAFAVSSPPRPALPGEQHLIVAGAAAARIIVVRDDRDGPDASAGVHRIGLLAVMARHHPRIDARRRRTDDVSAAIVGVERLCKSRRTETRRNDYDCNEIFHGGTPCPFLRRAFAVVRGRVCPGACRLV